MLLKPLISVEQALKLKHCVFIDCRSDLKHLELGQQLFSAGHIKAARYLDLVKDLSGPIIPGQTGRHPLPKIDLFRQTIGHLGIQESTPVVVYDDHGGAFAARCWWMLRWLGHEKSFLLDGGLSAWKASGLELETNTEDSESPKTLVPKLVSYPTRPSLTRLTSSEEITASSENSNLLDARALARYNGEIEPIDLVAGHIPGAICLSFDNNINEAGFFKSPAQLRQQFLRSGISDSTPTICYCGSGVTACHNILALVYAGFPEPSLYAGSWSEWITDQNRPIALAAKHE